MPSIKLQELTMEEMKREYEERIFSNITRAAFCKAYFFLTTHTKHHPELYDPTSTMELQMFSFFSSLTLQSLMYTDYMCQNYTLVQTVAEVSSCSHVFCAGLQINGYFKFTPSTVSQFTDLR